MSQLAKQWTSEDARERVIAILSGFPAPVPLPRVRYHMQSCPDALFRSQVQRLIAEERVVRTGPRGAFLYDVASGLKHNATINALWRRREPLYQEPRWHLVPGRG